MSYLVEIGSETLAYASRQTSTQTFAQTSCRQFHSYSLIRLVWQELRVIRAMEAGIADHVWSLEEVIALLG